VKQNRATVSSSFDVLIERLIMTAAML